jgi:hypothetical protein
MRLTDAQERSVTIGYKVVKKDLTSAINHGWFYNMKYKEGKFVKPKIGKLFAFDTLEHAIEFTRGRTGVEIWEAQLINQRVGLMRASCIRGDYNYFWETPDYLFQYPTPVGTVYADEIKLLRRIGIGEIYEMYRLSYRIKEIENPLHR